MPEHLKDSIGVSETRFPSTMAWSMALAKLLSLPRDDKRCCRKYTKHNRGPAAAYDERANLSSGLECKQQSRKNAFHEDVAPNTLASDHKNPWNIAQYQSDRGQK